uniref:Putative secreted protein n=1 Tax=Ixodes ricinus TaxID=34613 RepID=A0A6B0UAV6_IXORI
MRCACPAATLPFVQAFERGNILPSVCCVSLAIKKCIPRRTNLGNSPLVAMPTELPVHVRRSLARREKTDACRVQATARLPSVIVEHKKY